MGGLSNITNFWSGLTGPARRLIIGSIATFAVGIYLLMQISGAASYSTLAIADTPADAATITKELSSKGITYRLRDGGTTIQVPSGNLDTARLDLASSGLLSGSASSGPGFELFDKQGWGATDFTQRVNLMRARQGDLSRTLAQINGVRTADVKLAMPTAQTFGSDTTPTKASVMLSLYPGASLAATQVQGITQLVASAVPNLDPKNVVVSDTTGNVLNGPGTGGANARMAAEQAYETAQESKLQAMLDTVVGPGSSVAIVNAPLNLDSISSTSEKYDKKQVVPLEGTKTHEHVTQKGAGSTSGGTVGVTPNTPATSTTTGTGGNTTYDNTTNTAKNGVDRTVTKTDFAPGAVDPAKETVSIQVDNTVWKGDTNALTTQVAAAMGVPKQNVKIATVPFSASAQAVAKQLATGATAKGGGSSSGGGINIMSLAKWAIAGIGLLFILMRARKALGSRQSELEKALPELLARGPVSVGEITATGAAMPKRLEGETKSQVEQQMEDLALRKPDDMAKLMRSWLIERNTK
ncbi:MAG: flagellar basal-body MS-ring/collar protein FliF [Thermoleophilia bacterium]